MNLTHGALFNGIAGFPLAAAWAGIPTEWTVEIDEFCNKVSKKHFPYATQYTDIHEARNLPYVDIISGGFPCQPFSLAGKRKGNEDERALWPQMLRVIREIRPKYIIGENVAGLISMGLDDVLTTLEDEGYTTETFNIPACGIGAPHIRQRLWIVAYSESVKDNWRRQRRFYAEPARTSFKKLASNTSSQGLSGGVSTGFRSFSETSGTSQGGKSTRNYPKTDWSEFPSESPVCSPNDGIPGGLVRDRAKQLKAYGNAIVPQVAYEIFKAIVQIEAA